MTNNDIIRSLRYTLNVKDPVMIDIFQLAGYEMKDYRLVDIMRQEDDSSYTACDDQLLGLFLDGLIIYKRGKRETPGPNKRRPVVPLDNNEVLKKLRVAFKLTDEDIFNLLKSVGFDLSKSEINALFRKKGHANYKNCGSQILRNFLKARHLAIKNKTAVPRPQSQRLI